MSEIYKDFIIGVITLVVTGLGSVCIRLVSAKLKSINQKYQESNKAEFFNWLEETVEKCINTTTQTYVQSLKDSGNFGPEEQKIAMTKTIESVMSLLTEKNAEILSNYVGDISSWITVYVEDYIRRSKS